MVHIGGNVMGQLQTKTTIKNEIGESISTWKTRHNLTGFLDYSSGDSKYLVYNAKVQESTHVFVCDYVPLDGDIKAENSRMTVNGKVYDILLIDNPMELNYQLEIYLKFTGG